MQNLSVSEDEDVARVVVLSARIAVVRAWGWSVGDHLILIHTTHNLCSGSKETRRTYGTPRLLRDEGLFILRCFVMLLLRLVHVDCAVAAARRFEASYTVARHGSFSFIKFIGCTTRLPRSVRARCLPAFTSEDAIALENPSERQDGQDQSVLTSESLLARACFHQAPPKLPLHYNLNHRHQTAGNTPRRWRCSRNEPTP